MSGDPFLQLVDSGAYDAPDEVQVSGDRTPGVDVSARMHANAIRSRIIPTERLGDLPPLEPVVDAYLYRDSLAMLYGPSGSGKTFLALDWALCVATGSWWENHEVQAAPVLYVAAEGVRMISRRVDAWAEHNNTRDFASYEPVHWHPGALNLADPDQVDAITDVAADLGVGLIVFDTLARCTTGAEENSARDMGRVVEACDQIRAASNACVLLVHHAGKDGANGARGSSALRAAMDTEIALGADGQLAVTKAKDWAPPAKKSMRLATVGDSCVITTRDVADDAGPSASDSLEALRATAPAEGLTKAEWRDVAMSGEVSPPVSRTRFYAAVKTLVDSGAVRVTGTEATPRYSPIEAP